MNISTCWDWVSCSYNHKTSYKPWNVLISMTLYTSCRHCILNIISCGRRSFYGYDIYQRQWLTWFLDLVTTTLDTIDDISLHVCVFLSGTTAYRQFHPSCHFSFGDSVSVFTNSASLFSLCGLSYDVVNP